MAEAGTKDDASYELELLVAQLAVQRAVGLTSRVFGAETKGTLDKEDRSPVTMGDLGAQALIISALRRRFPDDAIVAEEEAAPLRRDAALCDAVWRLVSDTRLDDEYAENVILGGPVADVESMLDLLDLGKSPGGPRGRVWTIDPIDGTKGFLRGGQYAVCLSLIVDGQPKVGVLGCPNLPVDDDARLTADIGAGSLPSDPSRGVLFSAMKGGGATSRPLTNGLLADPPRPIFMRPLERLSAATFCESVEAAHSALDLQAVIAQKLGISSPGVRMDSQAKYGSIARGAGDIYLRLPVRQAYQEKIWDHAAGDLIVREAGGRVTDIYGKRLDFGVGRTLANNEGIVAAPEAVHDQVLQAVQQVLNLDPSSGQ